MSVSQDGAHSIRSVLNAVEGSGSEGWFWRADADYNTYITMFNADSEEARVQVSLDYSVNGERRSYQLPERTVPARVTELIDIEAVIAAGVPDPEGDILPAGVGYGGYSVRKVGPRPPAAATSNRPA